MKFNKAKYTVLRPGWGNPQYQYRLVDKWNESSAVETNNMSQQCVLAAQQANRTLGYVTSSRLKEAILLLCSTLVRPHLEPWVQLWSPQHSKDMDLLDWVQRRATKMGASHLRRLEHLSYRKG